MKRSYFICFFLCLTTFAAHPSRAQEKVLYNFQGGPHGANPEGKLTSHNGKFYGVTSAGGKGLGTVFKLSPNSDGSWNENVLHDFCSRPKCADGSTPTYGYVIFDSVGNMYGTTW